MAVVLPSSAAEDESLSSHLVPGVRRIGVLRAQGLGDTVFVLPALAALRAAYPGAEVTLLGGPLQRELLDGRGVVDEVVVLPTIEGVTAPDGASEDPSAVDVAIATLRERPFDLLVQLHGGGRYSNRFVSRLDAKLIAGCATPDAMPLDRSMPHVYHQNEVERWLEVVSLVGARRLGSEPHFPLTMRDLDEARAILPELSRAMPVVTIHPGAGDPRRRWPLERFVEVGAAVLAAGASVLLVGAEGDLPSTAVLKDALPGSIDLAGRLSLGGLAAVLGGAAVHLGNDSGPLHLARAVGTRTVGIYWYANLINAAAPGRRRHRVAIAWSPDCPRCGARSIDERCPHEDSFVAEVAPDEVARDVLALLDDARQEQASR